MTSRRSFLKVTAVGALSTMGASSLHASEGKDATHWDRETDVLIFGGGQAGLCAAISARENGAEALLLEKGAFLGGHTGISGSGYYTGGSHIQKAAGIDDSIEINWKDSVDRGIKANRYIKRHTEVVRRVYEDSVEDLVWLEGLGVKFLDTLKQGIGNRLRVHYVAPGYKRGSPVLIKTMVAAAEKKGALIEKNTKLLSLITETGLPTLGERVVGAVVEKDGKRLNIRARKGVVLACGGFANNPEMVERFHPYLKGVPSLGSKNNTGDGILAALEIGANLLVENNGFGMNMLFVGTHRGQSMGLPLTEAPIIVLNKKGERFEDESKGYLACTHKMVQEKFDIANWVFDAKTEKAFRSGCLGPLFNTEVVNVYDSLDALAKGENIDPIALKKTVAEYNEDVRKGKDRHFGRQKLLQTIDQAPFYAFECGPRIYTSYSGLEIDREARVLDTRGKPILGLYAAGDVTGHLAYQANLGGGGISGISCATVYGRVAGKNAAKA